MSDRPYDEVLYGDNFKISGNKIELASNILLVFDLRENSDWMQREADRMAGRSPTRKVLSVNQKLYFVVPIISCRYSIQVIEQQVKALLESRLI